jgi:predicted regulator of Ras-like GTPase activity (Roadblock/LC7/MglB family)
MGITSVHLGGPGKKTGGDGRAPDRNDAGMFLRRAHAMTGEIRQPFPLPGRAARKIHIHIESLAGQCKYEKIHRLCCRNTREFRASPIPVLTGGNLMLKEILKEFLQIDGVTSAALITRDGFFIESIQKEPEDIEALAALGSCAMNFFSGIGTAMQMGPVQQMVFEYRAGSIIITRVSDDELLAIVTDTRSILGRLTYLIPKISTRVAAVI